MNQNKKITVKNSKVPGKKRKEISKEIKKTGKHPGGARSKYDYSFPVLAAGYARDGLTDQQIAHNLGIATGTLYEYKKKFPEFSEALKCGKEIVDRIVENALYRRATGFEYEEVSREIIVDKNGDEQVVSVKRTTKMVVPDFGAAAFWLNNRKPNDWKDRRHVDHTTMGKELGPTKHVIEFIDGGMVIELPTSEDTGMKELSE